MLSQGLPRLVGRVTQASSSRTDSAQGCESQAPVGAKRRRSGEPDGVSVQKSHRGLEYAQVAAAVTVAVQNVDEVVAAIAVPVQNVNEVPGDVQGAAQVAAAEQAIDQEAAAEEAIDAEQTGAQEVAELQGVLPSVAWQRARPGEADGGPVFQVTTSGSWPVWLPS